VSDENRKADPSDPKEPLRPRATRLRLNAPVAYRRSPEQEWSSGVTVDISRSGVLFRPEALTEGEQDADVQLVIYLSRSQLRVSGVNLPMPDVYCDARVARIVPDQDGKCAIAVEIQREWLGSPPGPVWVASPSNTKDN
jgi:hypothetical protein